MGKSRTPAERRSLHARYSFLKIMTGSDLSRRRLAYMQLHAPDPGPIVWLTACAHGDEVGGIVVVQEVLKRLRRRQLLRGAVHAFPLMNPMGFEIAARHVAVTDEDLNRCFPGNPNGSVAQRLAHLIYDQISSTQPTIVLDLHNDWRQSIAYVVLDAVEVVEEAGPLEVSKSLARATGLVTIREPAPAGRESPLANTLSASLLRSGVPALTIELGEAYVVNEQNVEQGVSAIWRVLAELDMVAPAGARAGAAAVPAHPWAGRVLSYAEQLVSSTSGVLRFLVGPGDFVVEKQPIARIYNAFGKHLETLTARRGGVVLGTCDSSVAIPGLLVAAYGVDGAAGEAAPPDALTVPDT